MELQDYHVPVLLNEVLDALNLKTDGLYVDCTFGGGGHSKALLKRLGKKGKLLVFDQDDAARANVPPDERVTFLPYNFRHIQRFLRLHNIEGVDGVMADLGVSSHQFDDAERGFSTRFDAALDMRMDRRTGKMASKVIREYSEQQLHKLFEQYGEVTNSKTLAKHIVQIRTSQKLETIKEFKNALHDTVKGNPNKYFAQVFQALRIEVNDELGSLKEMLLQLPVILNKDGRVAIISFHSIEDRIVKNFLKSGNVGDEQDDHDVYGRNQESPFKIITKKPITASPEELKLNTRSRSAKLRVGEKK
ncbi:MAG: 16S rRNA (cytosine(1402)-N(4))-methyltransferase RsmH [Ferruginibacter sp.]